MIHFVSPLIYLITEVFRVQAFGYLKSLFFRLAAFFLIAATLFSIIPISAFAVSNVNTSLSNFGDLVVAGSSFFELMAYAGFLGISDWFWGGDPSAPDSSVNAVFENSAWYCSEADSATSGDRRIHKFSNESAVLRNQSCLYCGLAWSTFIYSLEDDEEEYVSDLDYSTVAHNGLFELYPVGWHYLDSSLSYISSSTISDADGGYVVSGNALVKPDGQYVYPVSEIFTLPPGSYKLYLDSASGALSTAIRRNVILQGKNEGDSSWTKILTVDNSYTLPQSKTFSTVDDSYDYYRLSSPIYFSYSTSYAISAIRACHIEALAISDSSVTSDSSTRSGSLFGGFAAWNNDNDISINADSVNFLLGVYNDDGELTDVASPEIYDEETLVFTEPVTGAQYITTGWKYYYNTRTYDITLKPGTFIFNDYDITRIGCTYGDDAVTIAYIDSNGYTVLTNTYTYVIASGTSCGINGHRYTAEVTTEPTCTSVGSRTYTCSVCGNQYVEDIPMNAHSYTSKVVDAQTCVSGGTRLYTCTGCGDQYTEVIAADAHIYTTSILKEPTCTDPGAYIYTCSTCGSSYTEAVEALGHDWILTDVVDTAYVLPADTRCPRCEEMNFSAYLDETNGLYNCTCNICETKWTVEEELSGYKVYSCSRCGSTKTTEINDDNSLFKSIGNFIANGINWCTEKLTQLVDSLTSITDTFNQYLDTISQQSSSFPGFLTAAIDVLPEDLMAIIWFAVILFIVGAVLKMWFE